LTTNPSKENIKTVDRANGRLDWAIRDHTPASIMGLIRWLIIIHPVVFILDQPGISVQKRVPGKLGIFSFDHYLVLRRNKIQKYFWHLIPIP
jgi:hypothetical protein